jgi:hypothetical protein
MCSTSTDHFFGSGVFAARIYALAPVTSPDAVAAEQHVAASVDGADVEIVAVMVRNGRMDILGANRLGRAIYSEMFVNPRQPVNSARFTFLDPRAPPIGRPVMATWPNRPRMTAPPRTVADVVASPVGTYKTEIDPQL